MQQNHLRAEGIRESYFYRRGSVISPEDILEVFYSPLDELVSYNQSVVLEKRGSREPCFINKRREDLLMNFTKGVKDSGLGLTALLKFDNGMKRNFRIKPRTNFDEGLKKRPNIVYLEDENGNTLILREARDYEQDECVTKNCREVFRDHYRKDIPSNDLAMRLKEVNKDDVVLVSEPSLILSLEQLYAEDVIRRITPHLKIAGASDNQIWYVRNFLPSIRDSHLDMSDLMSYVGTLHGLGLMDTMDSQVAHYCLNKKKIVNIDPDFLTYTSNPKIIDNVDWGDFKSMIRELLLSESKLLPPECKKKRRETIRKVQERMGGSNLLGYLPMDLVSAPSLTFLSMDNFFCKE